MVGLKERILKFNKNYPIDLSDNISNGFDRINVGRNSFTMRDFVEQVGHDDSLPYTGILCNNGKPLCECFNDGWGGMTEIKPLDILSQTLMSAIKLNMKNYKWISNGIEIELTFDFIADMLAINEYNKLRRTIKGKC